MKRILLSGASGVVGREIAELLLKKGYTVFALNRGNSLPEGVFSIYFDALKSKEDLNIVCPDIDVIVHFAASLKIGVDKLEKDEIYKVNVLFTRALLNLAEKRKIKKIIFASTFSFIRRPLPSIITEESPIDPKLFYSISKKKSEDEIVKFCEKHVIEYAILRISSPIILDYSVMHSNVVKKWIKQSIDYKEFVLFGNGKRSQDFISTSDIAKSVLLSIETKIFGIYNIASGSNLSMLKLAEMISDKFKSSFKKENIEDEEEEVWNISIKKAKRDLGFSPQFNSEEVICELLKTIQI